MLNIEFVFLASFSSGTRCADDFILVDNVCVRVYAEPLTWYEAQSYCAKLGHSLALFDHFELDKQLNRALFNATDGTVRVGGNSTSNSKMSKFWLGLKHLNATTWFDERNEPLPFRADERNWWPWLVVDSSTYNRGSCVGKRNEAFFLEDCYERMPFACQHMPRPVDDKAAQTPPQIHIKCGNDAEAYFQTTSLPVTTTSSSQIVMQSVIEATKAPLPAVIASSTFAPLFIPKQNSGEKANIRAPAIENEANLAFKVKKVPVDHGSSGSDTSKW